MDRRTLKRDKGDRLDLQQQLQAEIAAKTRIQDELTQITSQYTDMERYVVKTISPASYRSWLFLYFNASFFLCV